MHRVVYYVALASGCAGDHAPVDAPPGPTAPTVVSLTFDDTYADQYQVRSILAAHGMRATFYVNSSRLGGHMYMTREQLRELADDGHEIGGHTISHGRLTRTEPHEVAREVCNDRRALLREGFAAASFAYPFGDSSREIEELVRGCGYNSARDVGGLALPDAVCPTCSPGNPMPPANSFRIRTPDSVNIYASLELLQSYVTRAEQGSGGWVPLVFHHVCDDCSEIAVRPGTLSAFAEWLAAREEAGTTVRTVDEVLGGPVLPEVIGPPARRVVNGSLELDRNSDDVPDCWQLVSEGDNTGTFTPTSQAADGRRGYRIEITSHASGTRGLFTARDDGECAPRVLASTRYKVEAQYIADTPPHFTVFYRARDGAWLHLVDGPPLPPSPTYAPAQLVLPLLPADVTGLGFGLVIGGVGRLTVDALDFKVDRPATTAPPLSVTAPE